MISLMVLQWGKVRQVLAFSDPSPDSGTILARPKSGVILPSKGHGNRRGVSGSGGGRGIIASGKKR